MLKIVSLLLFAACVYAKTQSAIVALNNGDIKGTVKFTQKESEVLIEGNIEGLPTGKHGFHVHQSGDLSGGCATAKGHFNPHQKPHGSPSDAERHVGDLGNIEADANKKASFSFTDKLISLEGDHNIIGRALVIHEGVDDLGKGGHNDSTTTGHAGGRLACGVIGIFEESGTGIQMGINILLICVGALTVLIGSN